MITIIDFNRSVNEIANFEKLPEDLQQLMKESKISVRGFQSLLGHKSSGLVLELSGYWKKDKFIVQSGGYRINGIEKSFNNL